MLNTIGLWGSVALAVVAMVVGLMAYTRKKEKDKGSGDFNEIPKGGRPDEYVSDAKACRNSVLCKTILVYQSG